MRAANNAINYRPLRGQDLRSAVRRSGGLWQRQPSKSTYHEHVILKFLIRDETEADISKIIEVTAKAFTILAESNNTEQFVIKALRAAKALTISLVAEVDGRVIGHIAFSPVTVSDGASDWYGLGPVSVSPEYQPQGVGKALVQEGLSRLEKMNATGCRLVGHSDYYKKLGFENTAKLTYEGVPEQVFFVLSFDGHIPRGKVNFHEGFNADG